MPVVIRRFPEPPLFPPQRPSCALPLRFWLERQAPLHDPHGNVWRPIISAAPECFLVIAARVGLEQVPMGEEDQLGSPHLLGSLR